MSLLVVYTLLQLVIIQQLTCQEVSVNELVKSLVINKVNELKDGQ